MNYKKIFICALIIFLGIQIHSMRTIAIKENQSEQTEILIQQAIAKLVFKTTPEDIDAQFELGTYYYSQQDYDNAIKWYESAAEKGHVYAQYNLGIYYKNLETPNYTKAFKYFLMAAKQNLPAAQFQLGSMYETDTADGNPNYEEAIKWYRLAANQDDADAQYALGSCFYHGNGTKQNYTEAITWFKLAAIQENANAQYNLGLCYEQGLGVPQNHQLSVKWYRLAAKQGHAEAQYQLGLCYDLGQGIEQDYTEATKWYNLAATQGDIHAQYNLGICYELGQGVVQNHQEAFKWFYSAAMQGHTDAQYNVGVCYSLGQGVTQNHKKAIAFYEAAANQDCAEAQFNLSLYYAFGTEVTQNYPKAISLCTASAENGFVKAQFYLGKCYESGQGGVEKDLQKAMKWYTLAAQHGYTEAQYLLGHYYETKKYEIPNNLKRAFDFYTAAAYNGHSLARLSLGKFYFFGLGVPKDIETSAFFFYLFFKNERCWSESTKTPKNTQEKIIELCERLNAIRFNKSPVSIFLKKYLKKHLKLIDFLINNGIAKNEDGKIISINDKLKTLCESCELNMLLLEATDALESAKSISLFEKTPNNALALAHLNALLSSKPYTLGKAVILCDKFFIPYATSEWRSRPLDLQWASYDRILANMHGAQFTSGMIHCEAVSKSENIFDYIFGSKGKFTHRLNALRSKDGGMMRRLLAREMYWLRCMNEKYIAGDLNPEHQHAFEICKSLIETHFVSATGACANELADIIILWASDIDACEEAMGIGSKICDQCTFDSHLLTSYRQQLSEKILNIEYLDTLMKKVKSNEPIQKVYRAITSCLGPEFKNFYRFIIADLLNTIPSVGNFLAIDSTITRDDIESILSEAIELNDICTLSQDLYQGLADEKEAQENTVSSIDPVETTGKTISDVAISKLPIKEKLAREIETKYKISFEDFCKIVDQTCSGDFSKRLNEFLKACSTDTDEKSKSHQKNMKAWINGEKIFTIDELINMIVYLDPFFSSTEIIPELARFNTSIGCKNKKAAEYFSKVLYPIYLLSEGFIRMS